MRIAVAFVFLGLAGVPASADPAQLADLAKPPVDAEQYTIVSPAGEHGHSFRWVLPDGTHMGRESENLRGQVFETDSAIRHGADGMIDRLTIRGFTPEGDAAEVFAIESGKASWKSAVDAGAAPYPGPAMYLAFGGPVDPTADFVEALIKAPNRTMKALPSGEAHAEKLTTLTIGEGAKKQTITAYLVTGLQYVPVPVWVDSKGHFFCYDIVLA